MTAKRACHACGEPIDPRRLDAVPHTPWCVRCADARVPRVGGVMHAIGREGERELEIVPSVEQARERMSHSLWSLGASVTSEAQR